MAGELPSWFTLESVKVFKEEGGELYELDVPKVVEPVGIEYPNIIGSIQRATNIPKVVFPMPVETGMEQSIPDVRDAQLATGNAISQADIQALRESVSSGFDWRAGLIIAGLAWLLFRK